MTKRLDGRVAIITGASRGIGKAIALRLAQEGANVVIAAKSEQSSEKLPGSIYETAAEIEALGRRAAISEDHASLAPQENAARRAAIFEDHASLAPQEIAARRAAIFEDRASLAPQEIAARRALPLKVDVRSEEEIKAMVDATIDQFGRVDILINNAGALWWKPVLETPAKRFDLMMAINVRAAYLAAYYCLPHMVANRWGHIINMAPAIKTTPAPGMVAYMISKMGMAQVAIGIAEEHRADNVAANALWPVTPIETAAVINNQLGERAQWRTPEILCDATMAILAQEPAQCTGRQLTDEEILTEAGVTDFDRYWCEGKAPEHPIYIDGRDPHSPW